MNEYIPDRYDIIWLDFSPQTGSEHFGIRPALVLSPIEYNSKLNLCVVCPITSKKKNYFFEVDLIGVTTKGVILTDQIKSLDWKKRKAIFKEKISERLYKKVITKINMILNE